MKQDFSSDMLHDSTTSENQITTPEQFDEELDTPDNIGEEDALVEITSTRKQVMEIEDFIHMLKNKAKSIKNIEDQVKGVKEGIESYEDAYGEELGLMAKLDKEKKSDTTREPVPANSLTQHHMEAYKKLNNERQEIERLEEQKEMVKGQINDLMTVAEELFEEGQPVPREVHKLDFVDTSEYVDEGDNIQEPESKELETEEKEEEE